LLFLSALLLTCAAVPVAGEQFLVSQAGTGTHTTIQGALNEARFGDTIYVAAGVYEEGLQFKNGVNLIGAGPATTVIRYGYGFDPAVSATHASAGRIEGFLIERVGTTLPAPAVELSSASITLADCTISSAVGTGVEIATSTSSPALEDCTIRSCASHGVHAQDGARVEVRGCEIESNEGVGLLLEDASSATVRDTRFVSDRGGGVVLIDDAEASLLGSDVERCGGWGVDVRDRSALDLDGCTFDANPDGGLSASGDAHVEIRNCSSFSGKTGISLLGQSSVTIERCAVHDAVEIGIDVGADASCSMQRIEVDECGSDGIRLGSTLPSVIEHATVVRSGGAGIRVGGPDVSVTDSIVAYNTGAGIAVDPTPSVSGTVILARNDVWANRGGEYTGAVPRPTDLSAPPEFVDLVGGDLSLRPTSACIGGGTYGSTIGAHPDPDAQSRALIEFEPVWEDLLPGLDVGARVRFEPSPFTLETAEVSADYEDELIELSLRTSLAGTWGSRTSGRAALTPSPWVGDGVELGGSLTMAGVLDGIESWGSVALSGTLCAEGISLSAGLARAWPSSSWEQEAGLTLGGGLRLRVFARAFAWSPRQLTLAIERVAQTARGSASFSGSIGFGADATCAAEATWTSDARTVRIGVETYVDALDHVSAVLEVDERSAGASLQLTGSLAAGVFADGAISVELSLGPADIRLGLGLDGDGLARAFAGIGATFGGRPPLAPNLLPVPAFSVSPSDPRAGDPVTFDASISSDVDGDIVEAWWEFGDGDAEIGTAVTHSFSEPGTFDVALTVVDDRGATATLAQEVTVIDGSRTPVASFAWEPVSSEGTLLPRPLREGDRIRLDATGSYDPAGVALEYHWDLDSDGAFEITTDEAIVVVEPMAAGSRPVTLRVLNADGLADAIMHALVVGSPKAPAAGFAATPATPSVLDPVRFVDQSEDVDGEVVAWEWSFGDGHTARTAEPTHRFDQPGAYIVRLTVTDDDGLTDTEELTLEVALVPEITPVEEVWVLAIGLSDYDNVPDLQFGRQDAVAVVAWALDAGIPAEQIRLLTDTGDATDISEPVETKRATLLHVREALGWLRRVTSQDDLVLIFFSGHGYQGADDGTDERDGVDEFFVLADTVEGAVDDTALRDDEFGRFLDRLSSEHVLVFFDGCHSGGLARSLPNGQKPIQGVHDIFQDFSLEGRLVFSAADETQEAFESDALGHGIFTHFVLEGLRGAADLNGDRRITAWELYEYLLVEVPAFAKAERGVEQIPQIVGEGDVRVLVAQGVDPVAPAIAYSPTVPYAGGPVAFRDETAGDHDVERWTFGDGHTSTERHPTHVYDLAGTYDVTLSVRRADAVSTLTLSVEAPGRILEPSDEGWIISLGAQNGLALGDRFVVLGEENDAATVEVIELLGADASNCRVIEATGTPAVGDALRTVRSNDES